jgi:hypothetical protein
MIEADFIKRKFCFEFYAADTQLRYQLDYRLFWQVFSCDISRTTDCAGRYPVAEISAELQTVLADIQLLRYEQDYRLFWQISSC